MRLDFFLKDILINLDKREKDILFRRFGFDGEEETLAEISKDYNLSRERVRQIQNRILKKIIPFVQNHPQIQGFIEKTKEFLEPIGVKKEVSFHQKLKKEFKFNDRQLKIYKFFCSFSLKIYYSPPEENFRSFYAANEKIYNLARHFLKKIYFYFIENKGFLPEKEFISLALKEFKFHFQFQPGFEDFIEFLTILKKIAKNPFGFWGLTNHQFITPSSLKDKIYFLLRIENKPLHYLQIYQKLKEFQNLEDEFIPSLWQKNYQPNFIKNELIRNNHLFSFLGKGTYGLKEWGLLPGSAKDLILAYLQQEKTVTKDMVWQFVSSLRDIKKSSFLIYLQELALKNKIKIENNYLIYNG